MNLKCIAMSDFCTISLSAIATSLIYIATSKCYLTIAVYAIVNYTKNKPILDKFNFYIGVLDNPMIMSGDRKAIQIRADSAKKLTNTKKGNNSPINYRIQALESPVASPVPDAAVLRRQNGKVYTPSLLATYVASKVVSSFLEEAYGDKRHALAPSPDPTSWRILDPACGDGELLVAVWHELNARLASYKHLNVDSIKNRPQDLLCGIDIEETAISKTKQRIKELAGSSHIRESEYKLLVSNALLPYGQDTSYSGWQMLLKKFGVSEGFDFVIANPPWGADISSYKEKLSFNEFKLYQGQFDTSDLFLERALSVVKPNGFIAFIVPDSLFSQERALLRKLLLTETEIMFIGRLGEKFFGGVNRACAVIVCKKSSHNTSRKVKCLRLTPELRKQVLGEKITLADTEKLIGHLVPQKRFLNNNGYLFDIDLTVDEENTLNLFKSCDSKLSDYLTSGRGVELSKHGKICRCPECANWLPLPNKAEAQCIHCKSTINIHAADKDCIISKSESAGYLPILVGESIQRYDIGPNLWINMAAQGINYKQDSMYRPPKLLVRKTGVGVSAAIDYTSSLTNQVVYTFRVKEHLAEQFPIEFFLGLINSRALYYYVVKNYGETEWRSHPYITQKQVLSLPLPTQDHLKNNANVVQSIAEIVRKCSRKEGAVSNNADARIEYLVAQLYGFTRHDYEIIYSTLENIEGLLPVRALKRVSINDIFSLSE